MTPKTAIVRIFLFWFLCCSAPLSSVRVVAAADSDSDEACDAPDDVNEYPPPPKSCRLLLSPRPSSSQDVDDDGDRKYGIYSAVTIPKNHPLTPLGGDLVLHLIDVSTSNEHKTSAHVENTVQLQKWKKYGYIQEAATSGHGGNYEGLGDIWTVLPGISMLGASRQQKQGRPNIWASIPENDEASHPRHQSALAGSFALHYNLTHQVTVPGGLEGGDEVLVDRSGWHRQRALMLNSDDTAVNDGRSNNNSKDDTTMSIDHLFNHGTCLDNIYPGKSSNGYGRGALASRFIPSGSIVAPVPVLPLPRDELKFLRLKEWKKVTSFRKKLLKETAGGKSDGDGDVTEDELPLPPDMEWRQQLLLNYCYGHEQSSVLLFPYGVFVNYINHAPSASESTDGPVANVKLQWSERLMNTTTKLDVRSLTPSQLWEQSTPPEGLILELVALKDIKPDEEILLDYGSIWSEAWKEHSDQYPESILKLADDHTLEKEYSPAYIMDDVVTNLRTVEEQTQFPYPENVFTACFYRYDTEATTKSDTVNKGKTEATPWKMSLGLFDMTNLRPCKVISREPANDRFATPQQLKQQGQPPQGKMLYTAIIQNRPGLPANERIPKGTKHIVSGIPRGAFRFVDRPYASDIHLDGAFRHNIGVDEAGVYPEGWLGFESS
mmetsp:Transcript_15029/g.23152  ORF Transcript_15029/g.23152 Transcript_15029/m.23152 type:complete len:662 (+) Transcript_15029:73-2058(+)